MPAFFPGSNRPSFVQTLISSVERRIERELEAEINTDEMRIKTGPPGPASAFSQIEYIIIFKIEVKSDILQEPERHAAGDIIPHEKLRFLSPHIRGVVVFVIYRGGDIEAI